MFGPVGSGLRGSRRFLTDLDSSGILNVLIVFCSFCLTATGFMILDKHVKKTSDVSSRAGILKLVGAPPWFNEQLGERIYSAARSNGENLRIDEDVARSVQHNIESRVVWLTGVRVCVTDRDILIGGRWRKPLALVKFDPGNFYVDRNLIVMDYVPVPKLHVIEVTGVTLPSQPPLLGSIWRLEDLSAAVAILLCLERMDELAAPSKPLLCEIARIDVSNFNGRRSSRRPHIVLYTTDNTEVIWGAKIGSWHRYLESTDEEKLAGLYEHYRQVSTLLGGAKYIDLRDPQSRIFLPVDRY